MTVRGTTGEAPHPPRPVEVVGSVFRGRERDGDFAWMIRRPEHRDVLFVFNDNEEQFRAFLADPTSTAGCGPGGGNAVIRPWRCSDPPRAAGVPTGVRGAGYGALTEDVAATIDEAIAVIRRLVSTGRYRRVLYSATDEEGDLGTGIFTVSEEVRRYIVRRLRSIEDADPEPPLPP